MSNNCKIGVYVCHCGSNIAGTVDCSRVVEAISGEESVVISRDYQYMCSDPGQELIRKDIKELGVNRVVVASCSPRMHEKTFRNVIKEEGLNPYLLEMANIREQCSWVTDDHEKATEKAAALVRAAIHRVVLQEPLETREVIVNQNTLVVGGGIAGVQCSLQIAQANKKVYLVEREPSIGGHMAMLDKTFPTLDCSACILTPKLVDTGADENIELLTYSEVIEVSGSVGNFKVKVKKKPRYIDYTNCTSCGECDKECPVNVPNEFENKLTTRKAIYRMFAQAVPNSYAIDKRETPPCKATCPIGQRAQGYIALVAAKKFPEAYRLIREDNPFPSICGRACTHPCEDVCRRNLVDEPMAIAHIKRFVADWAYQNERPKIEPARMTKKEKIAIIGSGPAGLSAAESLIKMGYPVTVFEAQNKPGGMLQYGIPEYRLPKKIVDREIDDIKSLGVEIKTETPLGKNKTLKSLFKNGYSAILISSGAHKNVELMIDGENIKNVYPGTLFLKQVADGTITSMGEKVVVVGGGNTAIDSARTALRLGAKDVSIAYRRTENEMPAMRQEIAEAKAEGVKFEFLASPTRIIGRENKVFQIEFIKNKLGEPDSSGRRRPIPIPGSEFLLRSDVVITAIGQIPDLDEVLEGTEIEKTNWGTIPIDPITCMTSMDGVFAAGDVVLGPATIAEAIASGKQAALSINAYLRKTPYKKFKTWNKSQISDERTREIEEMIYYGEIKEKPRVQIPLLNARFRATNFAEVAQPYTEEQAIEEASRCLNCGVCCECHECEKFCERKSINYDDKEEIVELEVGNIILATGYKKFDARILPQYGYKRLENVFDCMEIERMNNASGPTNGKILCTDGSMPKRVAMLHCIGSRDEKTNRYCSRVCCMYSIKNAHLIQEKTGAEVYEFFIDIRAHGKGYEEFYERVQKEGVIFIRGKVAEIIKGPNNKLIVKSEDTLMRRPIELEVDMVVLNVGMVAQQDSEEVAKLFNITRSNDRFFLESHPKLEPVAATTAGIYLAGACQGPKDIPETISQAKAAASEVLSVLSRGTVTVEAITATVNKDQCSGCKICIDICPYSAIEFDEESKTININDVLCQGCGSCVASCPSGALDAKHFRNRQILAQIEGLLR